MEIKKERAEDFLWQYMANQSRNQEHVKRRQNTTMSGDEFFEVEQILDSHIDENDGRYRYRIRWKGFDSEHDTWEPKENLSLCTDLLKNFQEERKRKKLLKKNRKAASQPLTVKIKPEPTSNDEDDTENDGDTEDDKNKTDDDNASLMEGLTRTQKQQLKKVLHEQRSELQSPISSTSSTSSCETAPLKSAKPKRTVSEMTTDSDSEVVKRKKVKKLSCVIDSDTSDMETDEITTVTAAKNTAQTTKDVQDGAPVVINEKEKPSGTSSSFDNNDTTKKGKKKKDLQKSEKQRAKQTTTDSSSPKKIKPASAASKPSTKQSQEKQNNKIQSKQTISTVTTKQSTSETSKKNDDKTTGRKKVSSNTNNTTNLTAKTGNAKDGSEQLPETSVSSSIVTTHKSPSSHVKENAGNKANITRALKSLYEMVNSDKDSKNSNNTQPAATTDTTKSLQKKGTGVASSSVKNKTFGKTKTARKAVVQNKNNLSMKISKSDKKDSTMPTAKERQQQQQQQQPATTSDKNKSTKKLNLKNNTTSVQKEESEHPKVPANKSSDRTKAVNNNTSNTNSTTDTVFSVFSKIHISQPGMSKQKPDTASRLDKELKDTPKSIEENVDFVKEKQSVQPVTSTFPTSSINQSNSTNVPTTTTTTATLPKTNTKNSSDTKNKSGTEKLSRKLSLKEYKAKKKKSRSSSSADEGVFLEFTRVPRADEVTAKAVPIRSSKSTDNTTILPPAPSKPIEKQTSIESDRLSRQQLATETDVLSNILGTVDEQNQVSTTPQKTSSTNSNLQKETHLSETINESEDIILEESNDCTEDDANTSVCFSDLDEYSGDEELVDHSIQNRITHLETTGANSKKRDNIFVNQCICAGNKDALIECVIAPNMINEYVDGEDTLLMKAVMECAPDMVRILMEKGADPNFSSRNGKTPLMTAVELNQKKLVIMLIQNGAYLNMKTSDGRSALDLACSAGSIEIVHVLLSNGADIRPTMQSLEQPNVRTTQVPPHMKQSLISALRIQYDKLFEIVMRLMKDFVCSAKIQLGPCMMPLRCISPKEMASIGHTLYFESSKVNVSEKNVNVMMAAIPVLFERNGQVVVKLEEASNNGVTDVVMNPGTNSECPNIQVIPDSNLLHILFPAIAGINELLIRTDENSPCKILISVYQVIHGKQGVVANS